MTQKKKYIFKETEPEMLPESYTKTVMGMEITYTKVPDGDYYLPDLITGEEDAEPLGRYGMKHKDWLEEYHHPLFTQMLLSGKLQQHCLEVQERALEMKERLIKQMAQQQGLTEEMKNKEQLKWVGLMNNIYSAANEIIYSEVIYSL